MHDYLIMKFFLSSISSLCGMEGINDESNPEELPQWHSNTPLAVIGPMLCIQHNNIRTIGETETLQPSTI